MDTTTSAVNLLYEMLAAARTGHITPTQHAAFQSRGERFGPEAMAQARRTVAAERDIARLAQALAPLGYGLRNPTCAAAAQPGAHDVLNDRGIRLFGGALDECWTWLERQPEYRSREARHG